MTKTQAVPANRYSPSEAVALAVADHRAGQLTDWPFIDALHKAEVRLETAIEMLRYAMNRLNADKNQPQVAADIESCLRELGELS